MKMHSGSGTIFSVIFLRSRIYKQCDMVLW